jgi:hypothetical protein
VSVFSGAVGGFEEEGHGDKFCALGKGKWRAPLRGPHHN